MKQLIEHSAALSAIFNGSTITEEKKPGRIDKLILVCIRGTIGADCLRELVNYCMLNNLGYRMNLYTAFDTKTKIVLYFWRLSDEVLARRLAEMKKEVPLISDETERTLSKFRAHAQSIEGAGKRLCPLRP